MMSIKNRIIIKAICLLVLILLCIMIYMNGKELKCDKCLVKFISRGIREDNILSVKIMDLQSELNKSNCLVKWNEQGGFYITRD